MISRCKRGRLVAVTLAFLSAASLFAKDSENWPAWRGPESQGSTDAGSYPSTWSATNNLVWKAPLPGKGSSTPVVWQKQIFLTAPAAGRDAVLAFDWAGRPLWQTTLGLERKGKHANGSGSNPSPATDGHALFVCFKSGDLARVDLDGKVAWKTNCFDADSDTLFWDYGTSPVLTENDVVIARMHHGDSYVAAFDKTSGRLHWKVPRQYETPEEDDHSYASPLVAQSEGRQMVLVWGALHLTAHAALDGKLLWSCGDFNPQARKNWVAVASPVLDRNVVVIPFGRGNRLDGIQLGGSGDVTATHRLWLREDTGAFVPTPAVYRDRVYLLRDRGEIECLDPKTGTTIWSGALPRDSAAYYASPVVAAGKLYCAREDGVVFVTRAEGPLEILGENDLKERVIASPVPVSSRLLFRAEKHLFCIGERGGVD